MEQLTPLHERHQHTLIWRGLCLCLATVLAWAVFVFVDELLPEIVRVYL